MSLRLSQCVLVWLLGGVTSTLLANESKEIDPNMLGRLQASLKEKTLAIEKREEALLNQQRLLSEKERILSEQTARYETVIRNLKKRLEKSEKYQNQQANQFKQIYARMDPKKAAKILDKMQLDLVGVILTGIRKEQAAEILGKMEPRKGRLVTERYMKRLLSSQKKARGLAKKGG